MKLVESSSCGPAFLPVYFCLYLGLQRARSAAVIAEAAAAKAQPQRSILTNPAVHFPGPVPGLLNIHCWRKSHEPRSWFHQKAMNSNHNWALKGAPNPLFHSACHAGMFLTYSQPYSFRSRFRNSNSTLVVMFCRRLLYILLRQPTSLS